MCVHDRPVLRQQGRKNVWVNREVKMDCRSKREKERKRERKKEREKKRERERAGLS